MTNNKSDKKYPVVTVDNLKVHFPLHKGVFGKSTGYVKAVDSISFTIDTGDVFAIVGESGCGKTTAAQAVLGLNHITDGHVQLYLSDYSNKPVEWVSLDQKSRRKIRKHIQIVFQDPYSSLNPRLTIGSILEEPLQIHNLHNKKDRKNIVVNLMKQVGLSSEYLTRYPHEFSGGQRQRVGIARALATNPQCIVADEPVSALDVSIQAQIINLMQDLRASHNLTQLFISHDLAVVRHLANKVAVMYLGKIVESGSDEQIFTNPKHPYTMLLLDSIPIPGKGRLHKNISGEIELIRNNTGCNFYSRCNKRSSACLETIPELKEIDNNHFCACINI
jgi:oligopeptide/dipeptide ABC transporter ATP-binding protein